jgi:hypothetical protein
MVWLCYYSDFPLVCLEDFQVKRVWKDFGATRAVAVREDQIIQFPAYGKPYLSGRKFGDYSETVWNLIDHEGTVLSKLIGDRNDKRRGLYVPFSVVARGPRVYICTETALFELP